MTDVPIRMAWDGEALRPVSPTWARRADKQWVAGEQYNIEVRLERSSASHAHYFAAINEAWQSLPERMAERFASPEQLRKYALIRAGFRDERTLVAASEAEAERLAAFVKPMDEFAIVVVDERTVTVYTAQSQSYRAMGKEKFEQSKTAVLDILARMIGTTADELRRASAA